jgi:hypothetical protein
MNALSKILFISQVNGVTMIIYLIAARRYASSGNTKVFEKVLFRSLMKRQLCHYITTNIFFRRAPCVFSVLGKQRKCLRYEKKKLLEAY